MFNLTQNLWLIPTVQPMMGLTKPLILKNKISDLKDRSHITGIFI